MASYRNTNSYNPNQNTNFFSKMLRKISNNGMVYNTDSVGQSFAIGVNDDINTHTNMGNVVQGPYMYDLFTKKMISKLLDQKSIAYLDRTYFDKRKILQQYAIKDEIRDFINQIADEVVFYDDNNKFCKARDLPDEFDDIVRKKVHENFNKLYTAFGFNDGITAWNHLKDLLIDGFIAFEIVYDKKQKNITELRKLDPLTLVVAADPDSGTLIWVQYPDDPRLRRVLLDAQIVYISYNNNKNYGETSYVEPLIRPYNQLKLIEQTKILYNINQAAIYKKFIIPVGGLSRQAAEQQIYQLMSEYHEDIQWDDELGKVSINGSPNIPHSKDFWFPSSTEGGTPDVSIETPSGNDLNEDQILNWFNKNLLKSSRIPIVKKFVEKYYKPGKVYFNHKVYNDNILHLISSYSEYIEMSHAIILNTDFIGDMKKIFPDIKFDENTGAITEENIIFKLKDEIKKYRLDFDDIKVSINDNAVVIASKCKETLMYINNVYNDSFKIESIPDYFFEFC